MKRVLMAGLLIFANFSEAGETLYQKVRVYDMTRLSASDWFYARAELTRIFAAVNIKLAWEKGDPNAAEARLTDLSVPVGDWSAVPITDVVSIRLVPTAPGSNDDSTVGVALPYARQGVHVTMFRDALEQTARSSNVNFGKLLGSAIAHEIGHVLLRSSGHSSSGLMRAKWDQFQYRMIDNCGVGFTDAERDRLRANLRIAASPELLAKRR
jgi:hypothetical protein